MVVEQFQLPVPYQKPDDVDQGGRQPWASSHTKALPVMIS